MMSHEGDGDPDQTKVGAVDPLVGTVLDRRYRLEFRLASGGFGAIYRAVHLLTRRQVAVKVLHRELATTPDVVARFRREGAALAQLRDAHTVTAYDLGETSDGILYLVMELLRGESLFERFRAQGPLPWRKVVAIARAVCSSLAEAHALGIIHRDLKPTNIHLEPMGEDNDFVKVLDFGIAKILHDSVLDSADLTRTGQMIGTFDYMAPEQMLGGECSPQSDIFTLGVVMYEMIAGVRPFGEPPTPSAMLAAIISRAPTPLATRTDVPVALDAVIARCLAGEADDRFRDVSELAALLEQISEIEDETSVVIVAPRPIDATLRTQITPLPIERRTTERSVAPDEDGPDDVTGDRTGDDVTSDFTDDVTSLVAEARKTEVTEAPPGPPRRTTQVEPPAVQDEATWIDDTPRPRKILAATTTPGVAPPQKRSPAPPRPNPPSVPSPASPGSPAKSPGPRSRRPSRTRRRDK